MREVLIIIRREFLERVRTRAFILGTLLFPVFMIGIFAIPILVARGGDGERRFALVDQAPPPIGDRFMANLTAMNPASEDERGTSYSIERVAGTLDDVRDQLTARVLDEELDGYVVLPADVVQGNRILFRARTIANPNVLRDVRNAANEAIQAERLRAAGLEGTDVAALIRPVSVDDASVTESGEGRGAEATFLYAYVVSLLIYMITAIYGISVLRSVLEEKTNRIAEVLVSSVRASRLMLGKIVGVGSAAILQVAIWVGAVALIATRSDLIAARFGIPREAFGALTIPVGQAILFGSYFVLGFMLFAAMFAAAGSALTSEQEAQSIQFPLMMPLFIPLILQFQITAEPLGRLATFLGLFPFTAPMTMPMRISATTIPATQIAASLVLLVLALMLMAWLGGKIFRIGILSTGKKPSLREVMMWLKEA